MKSQAVYLFSGVSTTTTGTVSLIGADNISIGVNATGAPLIVGTFAVEARLEAGDRWIRLYNTGVNATNATFSGYLQQLDGPVEAIRVGLNTTSGTYNSVCRYSISR